MNPLDEYKKLIMQFIDGQITAVEFRDFYFQKYQNDTRTLEEQLFEALDELQGDVDAYEPDQELYKALSEEKPNWYLNESGLREKARAALQKLSALENEMGRDGQKKGVRNH